MDQDMELDVDSPTSEVLFRSTDYLWAVGEADFSFTVQLALKIGGQNIFATTLFSQEETYKRFPRSVLNIQQLERMGSNVNYNIDCTKCPEWNLQFDCVVFNFPEVYDPVDVSTTIPRNQRLLRDFLNTAARQLMPEGRIIITMKPGWPFDEWDVVAQAEKCPFLDLHSVRDSPTASDFPSYTPLTDDGTQFDLGSFRLYVFKLKPEFNTEATSNTLRSSSLLLSNSAPEGNVLLFPFGEQGIMYHLGLKAGKGVWTNPVAAGIVKVHASRIKRGSPLCTEVGDAIFSSQVLFTENTAPSWVTIDFSPYLICPSHYRMAHRGGHVDYYARNWEFAGSTTGVHWKVLKIHKHDGSISEHNLVASWPLEGSGEEEFFSSFRIQLEPCGNSRGTHALVLTCFEIFGRLEEPPST
eukprot:NODE_1820_length_1393_cov_29.119792_g1647_i0.p1 GENE.NODE_1820_length_1393_cov_29.119792_g1647_i0~~NODE_1820_length_1393_cov_29.119792_g1647_i0.p1  ORF type:complete len:411 (-),score=71.42 NODE_1820_length_1393_cov_29.119792_g1647_i0:68-1300(-)